MAGRPTDDELREMLRALPRPEPPPGFAEEVMARVHAEDRARVHAEDRRRRFRPWLLAAAAAALVASGLLVRSAWDGPTSGNGETLVATTPAPDRTPDGLVDSADPDRREFEAILEEYRLLAAELEAMSRLGGASSEGPVIRIGGNDDLDLFLDLESYLDRPSRPPGASLVVPAANRPRR